MPSFDEMEVGKDSGSVAPFGQQASASACFRAEHLLLWFVMICNS